MLSINPKSLSFLVGIGATLSLTPAIATPMPGSQNNTNAVLLAQGRTRNYCKSTESTFLQLETKQYWVNICGGDLPAYYVGVEKRNPKNSIRLRLKDYDQQGTYFEAVNGKVTYILADTPRGKFLTVSQGVRELLREPILRGW